MIRLLAALAASVALLAAPGPAAAEPDPGMATWSVRIVSNAKARIESFGADLFETPVEAQKLAESTRAKLMSGEGVRGFTYFVILLFVGIGIEWLFWIYAYASLRAVEAAPAATPLQALRLGLRRLLLQVSGLLLFTLATIGVSGAFAWPPGVHELVVNATLLLLVLRLAWACVSVVFSPGRPQRRLVPVDADRARWLAAALIAVIGLLALGRFVPDVLGPILAAPHLAGTLRLAAVTAAAALVFVSAFAFFGRRSGAGAPAGRGPLFPRSFLLALLVVAVYAIWLVNPKPAAVAAIIALVVALELGLHEIVYFFWRGDGAADPEQDALPAIALSVARFVVALLGLGACALAIDTPIDMLAETVSPWLRVGMRLLGVAVLALLAHGVWIAIRTVIDHRLSRIAPPGEHAEPDPSSRLLTLLPLLRVTAAVLLLVMLVLSSLWALGIEITPLLAGAGVVGLALGFGAQALVRDVIAGIFFLAEDAFRIGEYIESGTNTKGTVERITLRTVALRHHNGPLHFVPYGTLGTVRGIL